LVSWVWVLGGQGVSKKGFDFLDLILPEPELLDREIRMVNIIVGLEPHRKKKVAKTKG